MRIHVFALALGSFCASFLPAAAATVVSLGDFSNPVTLDFEGLAPGLIAENDPAFLALGITGIAATGTSDVYNTRPNSSRALGYSESNGLEVVDPGANEAFNTVTLSFASDITQFGFGVHDEDGPFTVAFRNDGVQVGLYLGDTIGSDLNTYFFEADPFDTVFIGFFGGFYLDDLTISTPPPAAVPAPLPLASLALGLGAMAALRRRRG